METDLFLHRKPICFQVQAEPVLSMA